MWLAVLMWQQIFLILFVECGRYFYFQILCFIVIGFFMIGNHVFPIDLEVTREGQSSTPNKIDGSFKISVESNKRSAIRTIYEKKQSNMYIALKTTIFLCKIQQLKFQGTPTNSQHKLQTYHHQHRHQMANINAEKESWASNIDR